MDDQSEALGRDDVGTLRVPRPKFLGLILLRFNVFHSDTLCEAYVGQPRSTWGRVHRTGTELIVVDSIAMKLSRTVDQVALAAANILTTGAFVAQPVDRASSQAA